jgi:hypothetical protein
MISNTEIIEMPSIVFLEAVVVEWTLLKGEEECLACRPSIKLTPKVECPYLFVVESLIIK